MSQEAFGSYRVGEAVITRIPELELRDFRPEQVLPDWDPEQARAHEAALAPAMHRAGGKVLMSVHAWLVQDRGRTILVDTGVGNDKPRPFTPDFDRLSGGFLDRLAAVGVRPEDVDLVLLTHLHVDHVGWNTRLIDGAWRPTFPRARYVFSGKEYAYFTDPANDSDRNKTSFIVQKDSVAPLFEAGQADPIPIDGRELIAGFRFLPTPGHTIDHSSIELTSAGETALFPGDLLHHPSQVFHPEWNSVFDAFPGQAAESRRAFLARAADTDALVLTTHFASPSAGKISPVGAGFAWRFADPGAAPMDGPG
jgi:glyoxylase-like metal-dependent hydrolase (beta-lactamase superfamily II)